MKLHASLLCLLLLGLTFVGSGCLAQQNAVVGYATVEGTGDVRTDGNAVFAIGNLTGEAGIFAKGSGFPLVLPVHVEPGTVYLKNASLEYEETLIYGSPLPSWAATLFRPGEAEELGITFELE